MELNNEIHLLWEQHVAQQDMRNILHKHLDLTKSEAVARLSDDYTQDIALYDQIVMADEFTRGIVKQFPNRFVC